jgi:hypothetical protein
VVGGRKLPALSWLSHLDMSSSHVPSVFHTSRTIIFTTASSASTF